MRQIICVFILLCSFFTLASGPALRFNHLSLDDGLSQSSVQVIFQDKQGFLWFGTADGLNRYDGIAFKVYRQHPDNMSTISDNYITAIIEDDEGVLWIGTRSGLNKFDRKAEKFQRIYHQANSQNSLSNNHITSIIKDIAGMFWVGTPKGLNRLDPKTLDVQRYYHSADQINSLSDDHITALYQDSQHNLWVGTANGGLNSASLTKDDKQFNHFGHKAEDPNSLSDNHISTLYQDAQGSLWVGTVKNGLNRFNAQSGDFSRFTHSASNIKGISHNHVSAIYEDKYQQLWIGTYGGGLNLLDANRKKFTHFQQNSTDSYSLSDDEIFSIFEDNSGTVWLGTFAKGLNKYNSDSAQFNHVRHIQADPDSLSHSIVSSFYQDENDALWVGTYGGGISKQAKNSNKFQYLRHDPANSNSLSHDMVMSVYQDTKGMMWFATHGGGLNEYDPATETFQHFRHDTEQKTSISHNNILSINEDDEGSLWIGTWGGGLDRYDENTGYFEHFSHQPTNENSLSNNNVWTIFKDSEGVLWLGTEDGLNKFDPKSKTFTRFKNNPANKNTLSHNLVLSIYQDSQGIFWLGTYGGGLNKFDQKTGKFTQYSEKDGLVNDGLYGILPDKQGYLWLSSNKGITKFDPRTAISKNYNINDGLQSTEFNSNAYYRNKSGEMFFGGTNGFNRFIPEDIRDNTLLPSIVFTDLLLFNNSVPIENSALVNQGGASQSDEKKLTLPGSINELTELTLSYKEKFISFEFAALHYTSPMDNKYAYKLEGWDGDWITTDAKNRRATYTNIPAGEYVFSVKGSNNGGYWNPQAKSLKVIILPPPWETWWAYTFYCLSLIALIFMFVQRQQRNLNKEHDINMRLKEMSKLKDEFLANTSHELRTPLNGIIGLAESLIDGIAGNLPAQANKNLAMVVTSGKRLSNLVNGILDFSKMKNHSLVLNTVPVDLSSMVDVVFAVSQPLIGDKQLTLVNRVDPGLSAVQADEDRLQQILLNLVGNAIKFSERGQIRIHAQVEQDNLCISISDNGIGIAKDKLANIFESFEQVQSDASRTHNGTGLGLAITRQLVTLHGGQITVGSNLGEGSVFKFTLPCAEQKAASPIKAKQALSRLVHLDKTSIQLEQVPAPAPLILQANQETSPARILLVDDDPINLQVLYNHLSMKNYHLVQVGSGQQALDLFDFEQTSSDAAALQKPFDLILLDIMMPRLSGYDVCKKIRESFALNELPIIFLTAKNQVSDFNQSFSVGGNDYLSKPILKEELFTRVESQLKLLDINNNLEQQVAKRTAELEHANDAKSEFLAKMSHEIRTPMNAIIGLSHLALKTKLDTQQSDLIEKVQQASQSLLELVNGILDFSKIEAGKITIESTYVNIESLIRETVNIGGLRAHDKNLDLIVNISPQIPSEIISDPLRLKQILVNLIDNAIKFTDKGHVLLDIEMASQDPGATQLKFSVSDSGIGLNDAAIKNLFQSFSQADSTITRKFGGTGLGLSICKQLTELMGGEIWVESQPGLGSKFSFTITFEPLNTHIALSKPPTMFSKLKVLAVDDNPLSLRVLSELLCGFGCHVVTADKATKALAILENTRQQGSAFDLVITDWRMPDMDGIELARAINQNRKESDNCVVLMASAFDKTNIISQARNAGIHSFLEKPLTPSLLLDSMMNVLRPKLSAITEKIENTEQLDLSGYSILIVEDNKLNQQVILGFLAETRVNIDVADNGLQALEKLVQGESNQQPYDLVLMDLQMPEMDGITATREIRKQPNFAALPIVAMTAHAMGDELQRCLNAGMNDYFTKPINPNLLFKLLIKWLAVNDQADDVGSESDQFQFGISQQSQYGHSDNIIITDDVADIDSVRMDKIYALNCLDVTKALQAMGGRIQLYQKLVVDFYKSYMGLAELLQALFEKQEYKELHRLAHSLKSNAAYIGALSLSKTAERLEAAITHDPSNVSNELIKTQVEIATLIRMLATLSLEQKSHATTRQSTTGLVETLNKIRFLLEQESAKAEDLLPQLEVQSRSDEHARAVDQVIELVEDVEYPHAVEKIDMLLSSLTES